MKVGGIAAMLFAPVVSIIVLCGLQLWTPVFFFVGGVVMGLAMACGFVLAGEE
jgi:hypothetical protein